MFSVSCLCPRCQEKIFLELDVWWSPDSSVRWKDFSNWMSGGHLITQPIGRISLIGCLVVGHLISDYTANWKDFSDWMSGGHMTAPSDERISLI